MLYSDENKHIEHIYNMMLADLEVHHLPPNWAPCVKDLLSRLGFMEVWQFQQVGNNNAFLNILNIE